MGKKPRKTKAQKRAERLEKERQKLLYERSRLARGEQPLPKEYNLTGLSNGDAIIVLSREIDRLRAKVAELERVRALRLLAYEDYLQTPHWKEKRRQALLLANYHCSRCNSIDNLEVHHLHYDTRGEENAAIDLQVLCYACHDEIHYGKRQYIDDAEIARELKTEGDLAETARFFLQRQRQEKARPRLIKQTG